MTDGLKTGLILGGAAVIGYVIVKRSSTSAATLPGTTPPASSGFSGFLQQLLGHSPGSGTAPTAPTTSATPAPAPSSSAGGLKGVASTFWNADKTIAGGAYSAAVSIDKAAIGGVKTVASDSYKVASSAVHSILSIF